MSYNNRPGQYCKFFLNGNCRYGDACWNIHPELDSESEPEEYCRFFMNGYCRYGESCWNLHPDSESDCIGEANVQVATSTPKVDFLYHYTDGRSADRILNSGIIRSSSGSGDAAFGDGVYLTSLSPDTNQFVLINNNWEDGRAIIRNKSTKVQYYFQFSVKYLPGVGKYGKNRDVWLFKGDIDLGNVPEFYFGNTNNEFHLQYTN